MERIEIETGLGPIWLWGRITGRPVLLVVTGLFASAETMDHLPALFPDLDVLRTHLPGNHCPKLAVYSVGAFAAALSEALRKTVEAPLAIFGLSVGALVAMGVRHPELVGLLLVEPPVRAETLSSILGQLAEPADYTPLLQSLTVPTHVLVGDRPSGPGTPSLMTAASLDALRRSRASVTVVEGAGHAVQYDAPDVTYARLLQLVSALRSRARSEAAISR